jgi:general stress protein YciG
MTEGNDQGARHSVQNDAEFPDDERGLTGVDEQRYAEIGATGGEGQTARDVFPEDNGVPDVSQDDFPTMQRSEDPQFAPEPGDRESHETVSFGTTAREQAEGESLSQRLAEEIPDDAPDVRPAEDPQRAFAQLDQDQDTDLLSDSGTNRTGDDVEAFADAPVAGEGPEESAMHVIEGT